MAKKTGLGKGLDALFSSTLVDEEVDENEVVQKLKVSEIEPNRDQPRRIFEEDSLNELADSIKRYGVIQPIIVSKKENFYQKSYLAFVLFSFRLYQFFWLLAEMISQMQTLVMTLMET